VKGNRHVRAISQDVLTRAQTKIIEVTTLLAPRIAALPLSEQYKLPKMGWKTINFVEKACDFDFTRQNMNLAPPYLDMTAFGADFEGVYGLWTQINSIWQFAENSGNTEMTAGSEPRHVALVFHNSVGVEAVQDVSGAKAIYEKLGVFMYEYAIDGIIKIADPLKMSVFALLINKVNSSKKIEMNKKRDRA
jgi:hypothetical protein